RDDLCLVHLLSAPRCEDDLRIAPDDLGGIHDAILGEPGMGELRKNRQAAGDLDQLLDPSDARDERVLPLFEKDARSGKGRAAAWRLRCKPDARRSASASASGWHPTKPPSMRIIWKISATVR